ncbi:MAG: AAA family ATPase [Roseibium sp.]
MRFIDRKQLTPPSPLFDKRTEEERREIERWMEQTRSKGGTRRPPSSEWLDEGPRFRHDVEEEFGSCCAYCESSTTLDNKVSQGLVGRHRPKMLAQDQSGNTELAAYAWLTYDWENIFWICSECAHLKGNKFFTRTSTRLIGEPIEKLREAEGALILDPTFDDPALHVQFQLDGSVTPKTQMGSATIELLQLNRFDLAEARREALRHFAQQLMSGEFFVASGVFYSATLINRFSHSGAVTQVVRMLLGALSSTEKSVEELARQLTSMPPGERQVLADMLLNGNSPAEDFPQSISAINLYSDSLRRVGRIPYIRQLPTAEHPITRVEISNFKALRHIEFELPKRIADEENSPCMLLLGENATGKSSVLEAMALAVIGASEAAELDLAIKHENISPLNLIHRSENHDCEPTADTMSVKLSFLNSEQEVELTAHAGDKRFSGVDYCSKVVLGYGPRRFFTSRRTRRLRAPANRVRSLFDPMDMIANPILWLSNLDEKAFDAAARALREILMLDNEDDFERGNDPDTQGQIYIRQGHQRVAMKDMSVGYKSVISMVCDIICELLYHYDNLEYACAVVFIDEIETHLHPRWKAEVRCTGEEWPQRGQICRCGRGCERPLLTDA